MQAPSCFADIAEALEAAQDFIYICGWSVHPETRLTRSGATGGVKLGELLKRKAAERVTVCVLVRFFSSAVHFTQAPGAGGFYCGHDGRI